MANDDKKSVNDKNLDPIKLFDEFIKTFLIDKKSFIVDYKDKDKNKNDIIFNVKGKDNDIDSCLKKIKDKDIKKMSDLKGLLLETKEDKVKNKIIKTTNIKRGQEKNYILLWHCYYIMYIMYKTSKTFLDKVDGFEAKRKTEGDAGIDLFLDDNYRVASTKQVYSKEPIRPFRALLRLFQEIWAIEPQDTPDNNINIIKQSIKNIIENWANNDDQQNPQDKRIKNILLYLCEPDEHLPIISQSHKDSIEKYLSFLVDDNNDGQEDNDSAPNKEEQSDTEKQEEQIKKNTENNGGAEDNNTAVDAHNKDQSKASIHASTQEERLIRIAKRIKQINDGRGSHNDDNLYSPIIRPFWDNQPIKISSDSEDNLDVETLLRFKKAVVLYGPPGTSKTYSARRLAESIICKDFASRLNEKGNDKEKEILFKGFLDGIKSDKDRDKNIFNKHIHKLQLHANYTYEDFIAGKTIKNNNVITQKGYLLDLIDEIKDEIDQCKNQAEEFKKVCSELPHIMILDEINRVDISRIFGELFTAMEPSYRENGLELPFKISNSTQVKADDTKTIFDGILKLDNKENNNVSVSLTCKNAATEEEEVLKLKVPENLYFIGTMNLIDFSLEQVDFALRRRFAWVESTFDKDRLLDIIEEKVTIREDFKEAAENNKKRRKAYSVLYPNDTISLIEEYAKSCLDLNNEIEKEQYGLGKEFWIGHTFFAEIVDILKETDIKDLAKAKDFLWSISLKPMLEAYCGTMDGEVKKAFIKKCKNIFMPQDKKGGKDNANLTNIVSDANFDS